MDHKESLLLKGEMYLLFDEMRSSEDLKRKAQIREYLILANTKLVVSTINTYIKTRDFEDTFQTGCLGLIKAVDTFDMDLNNTFATYAVTCIKNIIYSSMKRERRGNPNIIISLQDNADIDESDEPLTYESILADKEDFTEVLQNEETYCLVRRLINKLSYRQEQVLSGVFSEEKTQSEVARDLGLSRQRVSAIYLKALNVLKIKLIDAGYII